MQKVPDLEDYLGFPLLPSYKLRDAELVILPWALYFHPLNGNTPNSHFL